MEELEQDAAKFNFATSKAALEVAMTSREIAEVYGLPLNTVRVIAKRLFPERIVNGVTTKWTEAEVTAISKEIKRNAGRGNSSLVTLDSNQGLSLPSTYRESLERAGEALKDLMSIIAEMSGSNAQKDARIAELEHQVEYDKVIGCSRWSDIKKLLHIKDSFEAASEKVDLEENVDYYKKCMGYDKWATIMLTDSAVQRIQEFYSKE